jgi:hypothetical protein
MKTFGLVTAALLATSPLGARLAHADNAKESREERAGFLDAQQRSYVTLAAMDIGNGDTVDVDTALGGFRTLRVTAIRGSGYIDYLEVRFGNGEKDRIDMKRWLDRDQFEDIDLNGKRRIAAITVHGTPDGRAAIQIVGLR